MKHQITRKMSCDHSEKCSDTMVKKLEKGLNCVFIATETIKEIHGSVSILHEKNNHIITVEFYEKDESSNAEHDTPFKKLSKIPTESEIKKII